MSDLVGLDDLVEVSGSFQLISSGVRTLDDLGALETLGTLYVSDNPRLTDVRGLARVTSVRDVELSRNAALVGLEGLEEVAAIEEDLLITNNDALRTSSGLERLASIGGRLAIEGNAVIESLGGLAMLSMLGDSLTIESNPRAPTCEATALEARLRALGWTGTSSIRLNDDAAACP